jgi:hypothetical protein
MFQNMIKASSKFEQMLLDSIPKPEWAGDCRDPHAGCWHVVDAKANSTTSDPVHCRKPTVIGTFYCEDHQRAESR